jgi:hypothetical protein
MHAARGGNKDVLLCLIDNKAEINAKNKVL